MVQIVSGGSLKDIRQKNPLLNKIRSTCFRTILNRNSENNNNIFAINEFLVPGATDKIRRNGKWP